MTVIELSAQAATVRAEEVMAIIRENQVLSESLAAVTRALNLEDEGWAKVFGNIEHEGLTLQDVQEISMQIREAMVKSPIIDRGAQLRHSYIWSKGIKLPDTTPADPKPGAKPKSERIKLALDDAINQRYVFSGVAQEELERAAYSDGNVFLLGDEKTKTMRRVPLKEITGFLTNPDFQEEVWAWRRTWKHTNRRGKAEERSVWYYTDDCPEPLADRAKRQIQSDPVDHSKTFIVQSLNRMIGWPVGIPDAVAVVAWAKLYSEFLKHGYVMSRALASIAFTATAGTKEGGRNMAMKLATSTGAGQTAVMGSASELKAMPNAGRGYDFGSGRPIAAMVATGVQVSIVHLLSDPGAAGSSYGSASNLDLPTKRAVVARQQTWVSYFVRVLNWLGFTDPNVSFPSLEEPDFYREVQAIILGWESGTLHVSEIRARILSLLGIETTETEAPEGVLLPNNRNSWPRNDIDPADDPDGGATSTASPTQGRSSGVGKGPGAGDIRTDGLGEQLRHAETVEMLRTLLDKVDAIERAA